MAERKFKTDTQKTKSKGFRVRSRITVRIKRLKWILSQGNQYLPYNGHNTQETRGHRQNSNIC